MSETVAHRLAETPFRPSWIRAPGRMQNTFCNEAFVDELAVAAGADPSISGCAISAMIREARVIEVAENLRAMEG